MKNITRWSDYERVAQNTLILLPGITALFHKYKINYTFLPVGTKKLELIEWTESSLIDALNIY